MFNTNCKDIREIIQDYHAERREQKEGYSNYYFEENPIGFSLIKEIETELLKEETKNTPDNLEDFFKIFWSTQKRKDPTFYIATGATLEAKTLRDIASKIKVPQNDSYPNFRTYKLLMTLDNSGSELIEDLPDSPKGVIINQAGNYLFDIKTLRLNTESNNAFINYANPNSRLKEPLGTYESNQIYFKNRAAYDSIRRVLNKQLENPGSISPKTIDSNLTGVKLYKRELFDCPNLLFELTGEDDPVLNFSWYHFFIPYRKDENTFPWIRFLITLLATLGTATLINALNSLSKCVNFCIKWLGFQFGQFFWYIKESFWERWEFSWMMGGFSILVAMLSGIIGYACKAIGFIIFALVSPISTYQQISAINQYAGYVFALTMVLVYAALTLFAGPLVPTLAGHTFVSFFSQLPFVPYIAHLLTPIGAWVTIQFIQPILLAIGIFAFESSLAVTTIITTPILLNALMQFLFDKIEQVVLAPPEVALQNKQTKNLTLAAKTSIPDEKETLTITPSIRESEGIPARGWPVASDEKTQANNPHLLSAIKSNSGDDTSAPYRIDLKEEIVEPATLTLTQASIITGRYPNT